MKKLSIKQQKFIDYYIELGNATEAAKMAGYSKKYVSTNTTKLLNNTNIKAEIDERLEQMKSNRIATAQEVMEYLTAVMRGETQEETVVIEGQGEGMSKSRIIKKQPSEKDRLKASELLAKRFGLLTADVMIDVKPVIISGKDDIRE